MTPKEEAYVQNVSLSSVVFCQSVFVDSRTVISDEVACIFIFIIKYKSVINLCKKIVRGSAQFMCLQFTKVLL